jgi:uncharacterized membrane protein YphA (DoxX/SURF4 family)
MGAGKRIRIIASWVLQIFLALGFVTIGVGKFLVPFWAKAFVRWGYPEGSHAVIGVVEVIGAVALLVPRLTSYAGLLLGTVMVGAMATHAMAGEPVLRPAPHLTLLLILTWLRWGSRWKTAV